jgi:prevent-host-death family protein
LVKDMLNRKVPRGRSSKPLPHQLNAAEAKANFSRMIHQASRGDSFVIAKAGTPVAKVVPPDAPDKFKIGWGEGLLTDEQLAELEAAMETPLPAEVLKSFHSVEKFVRKRPK